MTTANARVAAVPEDRSVLVERIARAHAARDRVRRLSIEERLATIKRIGESIARDAGALVDLMIAEGSIHQRATREVSRAIAIAARYDAYVDLIRPRPVEGPEPNTIVREPFGVVGLVPPSNAPFILTFAALAASFGAGNASVIRASARTARSTRALIEKFIESCPPDSIQPTTCAADQTLDELAANPHVRAVLLYAGSTVGKEFLVRLGKHYEETRTTSANVPRIEGRLKKYIAELAGNDPLVVLPGADATTVAKWAAMAAFANAGQLCFGVKRMIVARSLFDTFVTTLVDEVRKLKVGPANDPSTDIGPMRGGGARSLAIHQLEDARARGGEVIVGGTIEGDHIHPTIVRFDESALLARAAAEKPLLWSEECFAPIRSIVAYDDEEAALQLAADTPYGLGASVYGPESKCLAFAERLDVGRVLINESPLYGDVSFPIGGVGDSGFYGATQKIVELTYTKIIHVGRGG